MKKKILTILGTRPEIIRLSVILPLLDKYTNHKIVHTGQNYDYNLDKVFFKNFDLRKPDYFLKAKGSFANQISVIIRKLYDIILKEKPNRFLVLGDTNSSLGAIVAKRLGIPVFHMEAGNRQFDDVVPEEINRRVIDTSSDILLPYTYRSAQNLTNEGIDRSRIFVTGNPIYEVINKFYKDIDKSKIHKLLNLQEKKYFLITLHRQENVDDVDKLRLICSSLNDISKKFKFKIVWPIHPRTIKNIKKFKIKLNKNIIATKPLDFFNFIKLEMNAFCVLTDSGTVQEECAILKVPNVVLRDKTERPETIESGSTIISMNNKLDILNSIKFSTENNSIADDVQGYHDLNVSKKILNIILSNYAFDK
jgi:UDP-N-acetylglucosamine 2-epimerase (non-hydrolysing)|tara:strand:+ start:434 stop:1525 length:1092 start_codon:yes stop_codon:yes gene_type:complete